MALRLGFQGFLQLECSVDCPGLQRRLDSMLAEFLKTDSWAVCLRLQGPDPWLGLPGDSLSAARQEGRDNNDKAK